jgi:hypothetical protein
MSADGQTPTEDDSGDSEEPMMKSGNASIDFSRHISNHDTLHNPVAFDDSDSGDSFACVDDDETENVSNDSSSGEQEASESEAKAE